ncbi:arylsulfatase [Rubritalea tangerina]|uniref:Arylsulfatase n=2 Tax=Rubritalea tangerina TaxID=430798 RepID=A0ABW4Z8Y8_9BACT
MYSKLMMRNILMGAVVVGAGFGSVKAAELPNIIFIFADDMGVGDVSHRTGKADTPALDRMAREGMRFTDAHTTSSVCTPSRYGLLTGRYNWRTRLQKGVFFSPHDKPLIKKDESTVASILKDKGYDTACVGKWHLGIGWEFKEKNNPKSRTGYDIDFAKPAVTPTSHGFDYFYGIQASLDMAPYVYIENERATAEGSVTKGFPRKGAAAPDFEANQCLKVFAEKSVAYINQKAKSEKPFFLYLPLTSPHTPIVPSKEWLGKSPIGKYGDFLMETDWVVGQVLEALDANKITENTLVMFSTDNGCSPAAGIGKLVEKGHKPNGDLRGHKADIYEGGHRVPTLAMWPKVVTAGTETKRLTTLADFYATCAEIVGAELGSEDGVDSVSFLPTLKDASQVDRGAIVMHSINGSFAIRQGRWKLCFCGGSGGWSAPRKAPEGAPKWQLFDLDADPGEKVNVYESQPEVVQGLHDLMVQYIEDGRSTEGKKVQNDVEVEFLNRSVAEGKKKK